MKEMMLTSRKNFGKDWVAFFLSPHWESKGSEVADTLERNFFYSLPLSWVARNPKIQLLRVTKAISGLSRP